MNGQIIKLIAACAFLAVSLPAKAQAIGAHNELGGVETKAMVGITIPFGGSERTVQGRPKFDLTFEAAQLDQSMSGFSNPVAFRPERRNVRRARMSWTIEDQPRFLLNGRAIQSDFRLYADGSSQEETEGEQSERSTGKKILRGAAVAGGVVVLVAGIGIAAILIDCNSDDGCGE